MANVVYNNAKVGFADGTEDWDTNTYKVMLVTAAYVPDPDHEFVSVATAAELSGAGYVAGYGNSGRHVLAGRSVTKDDALNRAKLIASNAVWTSINAGTAAAILVIRETGGSDATSKLICCINGGFPVTTNGGDLTIQWDSAGVMTLT